MIRRGDREQRGGAVWVRLCGAGIGWAVGDGEVDVRGQRVALIGEQLGDRRSAVRQGLSLLVLSKMIVLDQLIFVCRKNAESVALGSL